MRQQIVDPTHGVGRGLQRQSPQRTEHTQNQNQERAVIARTLTYQSSKLHTECTIIIEDDPKGHPFTNEIMEVQFPPNWEELSIDRYNITTYTDEHIDVYKTHMSLYTSDKSVWCRAFPTILKGGALNWFIRLPSDLVDNFKTLLSNFDTQFATS